MASNLTEYTFRSDPHAMKNLLAGLNWTQVICPATFMGVHGLPDAKWLINEG